MIFTINDEFSFPIAHFMDVTSNVDDAAKRVITVYAENNNPDENSEILTQLVKNNNFNLKVEDGDAIAWESDAFTKMAFYFEIVKNDSSFEKRIGLTFSKDN